MILPPTIITATEALNFEIVNFDSAKIQSTTIGGDDLRMILILGLIYLFFVFFMHAI